MTGNPVSGGWNFYSLHITDALQDYPKFGVWPDGLYMSANMFGFAAGGSFFSARVWALNLAQMEAGAQSVQVKSFNVPDVPDQLIGTTIGFPLLPSNARVQTGTPPADRPTFHRHRAMNTGVYVNRVRVWKFHVDWNNTNNSTFTGPSDSLTSTTWACHPDEVPSKGGNDLDTLGFRLMMQNQYTKINGVESLWNSIPCGRLGDTVGRALVPAAGNRWHGRKCAAGVDLEPERPPTGSCPAWRWTSWATWPSATAPRVRRCCQPSGTRVAWPVIRSTRCR